MVFGAGSSLDYQHIAKLPSVNAVVMSDVVDLRGEADFINITDGTSERFDLIIACEVVEHFPDPMTEFPRLFDLLDQGRAAGLLHQHLRRREPGEAALPLPRGSHVLLQPRSIAEIAQPQQMQFDFRMPSVALGPAGRGSATCCSPIRLENLRTRPSTSAAPLRTVGATGRRRYPPRRRLPAAAATHAVPATQGRPSRSRRT